jgi:hypothetical protein
VDNEGWFDPWLLLSAFRQKAASLGVSFVPGAAVGFESTAGVADRLLFSSLSADAKRQIRTLGRVRKSARNFCLC